MAAGAKRENMAKLKAKKLQLLYDAAASFVDRVLRGRDSLFTPGQPVWSDQVVADLYHRFVEQPDASANSFEDKFEKQLAGAPSATVQLAAELLYVHLLAGNSTGGDRKRELVNKVLGWSPSPVALPAEQAAALDEGLAAEGTAWRIGRPFHLQYLLEFVRKWWGLGEQERSLALKDPWAFKEVAFSFTVPKSRSQAEILLHLVHPDTFEDIMSQNNKQRIADGFANLVTEPTDDVDRKLWQIRRALREREGRDVSFYEPRLLVVWQPESDPWGQFVKFAGLFHRLPRFDEWERDYKLRLAERAGPAILQLSHLPDHPAIDQLHKIFRAKEQNIVRCQDFEPFVEWYRNSQPLSHNVVTVVLNDRQKKPAERIRGFLQALPPDVVKSPASRTTLASFFLFALDPHNLVPFRARPFEWSFDQVDHARPDRDADEGRRYEHALDFADRMMNECAQRGLQLRDRLDAQGLIWAMAKWEQQPEGMDAAAWEEFVQYRGGRPVVADDDGGGNEEPPSQRVTDAAPVESDPVGRLLLRRKNVVLYGPPGTGKTHASLTLAEKWRRRFGEDSVLQVTFHPTFAYEDFIEGFRPDASGSFRRRDGIFVTACDRAHGEPARQFLLVIDELNRGDVARLFGELITLIEPDKRHAAVSRRLPYSQRDLWVPPNLHLLGTMNTADRSISLLDIAVRRRFCFVDYRPDPLVIHNSTAHYRDVGGVALGGLMDAVNRRLQGVGVDRDRAIGHSHFLIAAAETRPLDVLRDRFRFDILPLVEEYCYADRSLIAQVFGELVTDQGLADEEVLADDEAFLRLIRHIADGPATSGDRVDGVRRAGGDRLGVGGSDDEPA
jgi:5-methylcytosine-specific restriction protein B